MARDTQHAKRLLSCFAVSPPGFEDLVEAELRELGLPGRRTLAGVEFRADWRGIYRANLWCGVASRILVRIAEFPAETFPALEAGLAAVPWAEWLPQRPRLSFRIAKRQTRLFHTGKIEEVAATTLGACAGAREACEGAPGLTVYLRLQGPTVTVSLDTSGEHLHRRGYRKSVAPAPLRENVAAALLRRVGWDGSDPFLDPLCGSGTLAIEAARSALRIPPGWLRSFAFQVMPAFEEKQWWEVREEAGAAIRGSLPAPVFAADRDPDALRHTAGAAREAGLAEELQIACSELDDLEPPAPGGLLMTNPPWGLRLGGEQSAYRSLGAALRGPFAGWRWAAIIGRSDLERAAGLQPLRRHAFRSGGIRLWLAEGGPEGTPGGA